MFSVMMTAASTMRPKSTAPTERRFADSPRTTISVTAKASAKGMVSATMTAERKLPRNSHCTMKISAMPKEAL